MPSTMPIEPKRRWRYWIPPLVAIVIGNVFFYVTRGFITEAMTNSIVSSLLVLGGLVILFPLAAFGPKTKNQEAKRLRFAALGVGAIGNGFAFLIPDFTLRVAIASITFLFWMAASLRIPRRLFQSRAAG